MAHFPPPAFPFPFRPGDSTARNNPTQQRDAASDRSLSIPAINGRNPDAKHTDKLLPHLISLSQVFRPEDGGIDDTQQGHHVGHVVCGEQFVHDDTEAVLLGLHPLSGKGEVL